MQLPKWWLGMLPPCTSHSLSGEMSGCIMSNKSRLAQPESTSQGLVHKISYCFFTLEREGSFYVSFLHSSGRGVFTSGFFIPKGKGVFTARVHKIQVKSVQTASNWSPWKEYSSLSGSTQCPNTVRCGSLSEGTKLNTPSLVEILSVKGFSDSNCELRFKS